MGKSKAMWKCKDEDVVLKRYANSSDVSVHS